MNYINSRKRRYKIVDKKRFVRFIFMIFLMVLFVVLTFARRNRVYSSIYEDKYIEVKIERGDTLWDIARNNMPEEYDVRKMVFEIKKFNNIEDPYIYPGDSIKIPIK